MRRSRRTALHAVGSALFVFAGCQGMRRSDPSPARTPTARPSTAPAQSGGTASPAGTTGATTGATAAPPTDHERVRWHADAGDGVFTSPVGDPDTVYVKGDELYALDPADGSIRWTYSTAIVDHRSRRIQPVLHDGVVYASFGSVERGRFLDGIDVTSGRRTWRFVPDVEPVVLAGAVGDAVYVGSIGGAEGEREVVAVDTRDGSPRWRRTLAGTWPGSVATTGDVVVLATKDGTYGLDAATGETRWTTDLESLDGRPVVRNGALYGFLDGTLVALDGYDGTVRWRLPRTASVPDRWTFAGDVLYGVDRHGSAFAFDYAADTVAWQTPVPTGVPRSMLVPGDGRVYVVLDDGTRIALDAETGNRRWLHRRGDAGESRWIAASDRTVLVASDDRNSLSALDAATGTRQWRVAFDDRFPRPIVSDGTAVVGTRHGTVYGLDP